MKFYRIRHSMDVKITGKIPQIKETLYPTDVMNNSKFIGNIHFSKIDILPEVANPILYPKAKLTDLLESSGQYSLILLISGKFKIILEKYREDGIQFFQNTVFQNGVEYSDYWVLNIYIINNELIDYRNSNVILRKKKKEGGTCPTLISVKDIFNFEMEITKAQVNLESLYIKNLVLKNTTEDFFMLRYVEGGVGYFVSEKLKKEIEEAGCTGIEFQPSELSYDEWLIQDGPRDQVYGRSW